MDDVMALIIMFQLWSINTNLLKLVHKFKAKDEQV